MIDLKKDTATQPQVPLTWKVAYVCDCYYCDCIRCLVACNKFYVYFMRVCYKFINKHSALVTRSAAGMALCAACLLTHLT